MSAGDDYEADLAVLIQPADRWPSFDSYRPLNRDISETRLLELTISETNGSLRTSIHHVSLNATRIPEYEALSYCWGPPDRLKAVIVDGRDVLIRNSLYEFLLTLCTESRPRYIWLDAICINQLDVEERSWQVGLMGQIYSKAARVDIWLGPSNVFSDYAFSYMRCYDDDRLWDAPLSSEIAERVKSYLADLYRRPYWIRMWIVQEIALAKSIRVWCGRRNISWDDFWAAMPSGMKLRKTAFRFAELRKGDVADECLWKTVHRWKEHECADPRDKVYSLLNIAKDGHLITVDYSKSRLDVFLDLCATQISYIETLSTRDCNRSSFDILRESIESVEPYSRDMDCFKIHDVCHALGVDLFDPGPGPLIATLRPYNEEHIRISLTNRMIFGTRNDHHSIDYQHIGWTTETLIHHYLNPSQCRCEHFCTARSIFIQAPGSAFVPQPGDLGFVLKIGQQREFWTLVVRFINLPQRYIRPRLIGVIPMINRHPMVSHDDMVGVHLDYDPNPPLNSHQRREIAVAITKEIQICDVLAAVREHNETEWQSPVLTVHVSRSFWLLLLFLELKSEPQSLLRMKEELPSVLEQVSGWRSNHPAGQWCQCTVSESNIGHITGAELLQRASRETLELARRCERDEADSDEEVIISEWSSEEWQEDSDHDHTHIRRVDRITTTG